MKKNVSSIIGCIICLVVGYVAGAYLGLPFVEKNATSGDVNTYNAYQQMLIQPEYMSFNESMKGNEEAQDRTIESLKIMEGRLKAFATLAQFVEQTTSNNAELAKSVEYIKKTAANGMKVLPDLQEALKAAQDLKAGNKVDAAKALKIAKKAFAIVDNQMNSGKDFVNAVDALVDKNPNAAVTVATARNLIADHCSVNASLCQNDQAIDFWYNTSELLPQSDMAAHTTTE